MESDSPEKIGWTYIKNSVESRMLNDSLMHRLASTRKMQRRTKLFNAMLKKLGPMTRYSQYVKIKRMVLRNVSHDTETEDDDIVLTVNDYNSWYNSDESKNYTSTHFDDSVNLYCKHIRKSTHGNKKRKKTVNVSVSARRRSPKRALNKGQRRGESKKFRLRDIEEEKACNRVEDVLQSVLGKDMSALSEFRKDANTSRMEENKEFEKSFVKNDVSLSLNNDSQREEPSTEGEVTSERNIEIKEETSVKKTPKLNINNVDGEGSIGGQHLCKKARRNLTLQLENMNDTDYIKKEDDTNDEKDPETDSITECNPMGQSTPLHQDTMYQLKDSGIDEDSQEEFSGDTKYNTESMKINRKNKIKVYFENSPPRTTEEGVDEELDACDETVSNINFDHTIVVKEEDETITEENKEGKSHRPDLPQVTCTELVSKKYKIVREGQFGEVNNTIISECNTLPYNTTTISDADKVENDVNNDDKEMDKSQLEENVCSDKDISSHNDGYKQYYNDYDYSEDADDEENNPISPSTTKRLQQLKRLNLTAENVSSSSDEDTEFYFAKCPDVKLSKINDVKYKKNSGTHKKSRDDYNKENSCRNTQEDISDQNNEINVTNHQENQGILKEETPMRRSIVGKRPQNLQEFIDEGKLIDEGTAATFILKDVGEDDDIYMLNIPSTMLSSDLEGKRMVLKETKVRFGKDRYRISYRGEDSISCVMNTGKPRKPYKTVKIKLTGVITVREKLPRLIASTNSNQSACNSSFSHNETMEIPKLSRTRRREQERIDEDGEESPQRKRIRSS